MSQNPNVTIVLPVYNVEPYLRQCLDSVVNQTMREIQIICVNDGSTDGSPAILEEYAAKDPRIMVIHQENQGAGSARNAAFSHIQGKYTYFVDPDDWIELQLCEKLFKFAEEKQADIVYLGFRLFKQDGSIKRFRRVRCVSDDKSLTLDERKKRFLYINATIRKFWNSDFLLSRQITFAPGKRSFNDNLQNWKGVVHAQRIEVFNEILYCVRTHSGSLQNNKDRSGKLNVFRVYDEIREFLIQSGCHDQYKDVFHDYMSWMYFKIYVKCPLKVRKQMFEWALEKFDEDLNGFCQKSSFFNGRLFFLRAVFAKKMNHQLLYFLFSTLLLTCISYSQIRKTMGLFIE